MSGSGSPLAAPPAGPLAGIRVVDATAARAGPTCARQLADLGADVVQVTRGDALRGSDGWNLHRNKRSILLDLKSAEGRAVLLRLAEWSDVFVENWRPGVKHRLGIGPEALRAANPRLVYGSISGFGQDGPYAGRPAVDQIVQGMSGVMSLTGPPGGGPWRVGIALSDLAAGTFLAQGILAALFARERTGRGQWVHTSLLESMVYLLDFQAARWLVDGEEPGQEGNNHPTIPAMGTFATADGLVNVGVISGFTRFCELLGVPGLVADARFATDDDRVRNRAALDGEIARVLVQRTSAEWIDALAGDTAIGPVYSVADVFADPQVRHLGLTVTVPRPDGSPIEVLRHPVTLADTPASVRSGPHDPGADTDEILAELGIEVPPRA